MGVGIEVVTYLADHYRPPGIAFAHGLFGHRNVVQNAGFVLVVGGGTGTQIEIDLALTMGKRVLPLPASGGSARRFYRQARDDMRLRAWLTDDDFAELDARDDPAESFAQTTERLITLHHGGPDD